jgi:hypothetical protein
VEGGHEGAVDTTLIPPRAQYGATPRNGQFYESQKMYEWVLKHHDSRVAKTELALLHEDGFATRSRAGGQL